MIDYAYLTNFNLLNINTFFATPNNLSQPAPDFSWTFRECHAKTPSINNANKKSFMIFYWFILEII